MKVEVSLNQIQIRASDCSRGSAPRKSLELVRQKSRISTFLAFKHSIFF